MSKEILITIEANNGFSKVTYYVDGTYEVDNGNRGLWKLEGSLLYIKHRASKSWLNVSNKSGWELDVPRIQKALVDRAFEQEVLQQSI